jgi:molybdate transport system permease protein
VRQSLQYVQAGDCPVGLVALSEAKVPEVSWTMVSDQWHAPLDRGAESGSRFERRVLPAIIIAGWPGLASVLRLYCPMTPLALSLLIAGTAGSIALGLGTFLAWWLERRPHRFRWLWETIILCPLVLPPTVLGYGLLLLLGRQGLGPVLERYLDLSLVFNWPGAVVAATVAALPLVVQAVRPSLASVDEESVRAAILEGCGEWKLFWKILVPLSWRGLVAGGVLGFLRALGEFGATLMVAGNIPNRTQTLPMALYDAVMINDTVLAQRYAFWLLGISVVLLVVVLRLTRRFEA